MMRANRARLCLNRGLTRWRARHVPSVFALPGEGQTGLTKMVPTWSSGEFLRAIVDPIFGSLLPRLCGGEGLGMRGKKLSMT